MDFNIAVIDDMAVFSYLDAAEEPGEEGEHDNIRLIQNWFYMRNWAQIIFELNRQHSMQVFSYICFFPFTPANWTVQKKQNQSTSEWNVQI